MKQKLHPLCVALLALVLCNTPLFAHDFAVDGIYYDITSSTDKTVAVTYRGPSSNSYSNEYSGAVTIPESVTYSGSTYSVTSIGNDAFWGCSNLTSVEIPNSVTCIGDHAFSYCSRLNSVEIHNSVTSIGAYVFYSCSNLTSVVIPNSVTSIGGGAFDDCSNLTTATVGCSWITNPLYRFYYKVTVNATLHSYENGVCTVCGKEDTTGIDEITSNVHQQSEIFDLQGRRVSHAGKGLYIVNGKKVIMK